MNSDDEETQTPESNNHNNSSHNLSGNNVLGNNNISTPVRSTGMPQHPTEGFDFFFKRRKSEKKQHSEKRQN